MSDIKVGSTVIHKGAIWRVMELSESNIGNMAASLECLDRDAFASVLVSGLEGLPFTDEQVEKRIKARESQMLPLRIASMKRVFRKQIAKHEKAKNSARVEFLKSELKKFEAGVANV